MTEKWVVTEGGTWLGLITGSLGEFTPSCTSIDRS